MYLSQTIKTGWLTASWFNLIIKFKLFLQYRGKVTDDYIRALRHLKAPCDPVMTLRKLKTIMPSLKAVVDKALRSRVVYHISCSRCNACYVGQTDRHIITRFKEHKRPSQPYGKHIQLCGVDPSFDSALKILQSTCKAFHTLRLWKLYGREN